MNDSLRLEHHGAALVLTIDRPHARNAMDGSTAQAIASALASFEEDPALHVAILTGAGGHFCTGMDLKAFLKGELPTVEDKGFGGLTRHRPHKVLIAAVEGYALAGGFEMVLACDLVVASSEAQFGLPEPKRGLVASGGGLLRLPRRIPFNIAMEYALTGRNLPAPKAHEFGLVNQLTEPGKALEGALGLAREIAANAPESVRVGKRVLYKSACWTESEMFGLQAPLVDHVLRSNDAREGAMAFAAKMPPKWTGT